jgi:hypothetical protein
MQATNALPASGDVLTFRTPVAKRVGSVVWSLTVGGAGVLITFAAAAAAAYAAWWLGAPTVFAIGFAILTWALLGRVVWKMATAPLRFRVRLGPDVAELGQGFLKCSYRYDDVEVISVPEGASSEHGVGLEGGRRGAFVYLSATDERICVCVLRTRCHNAVFVDNLGKEHLPRAAERPSVALWSIYRRSRDAVVWSSFALAFALWLALGGLLAICHIAVGVLALWGIGPGMAGGLDRFELLRIAVEGGGGAVAAFMLSKRIRRKQAEMRAARQALAKLESQEDAGQTTGLNRG